VTAKVGNNLNGTVVETIDGTAGANLLNGRGGIDALNGLEGADTLNGGGGSDTLNGGIGDDLLNGGLGNDRLTGGDGNDVIDGGDGIADTAVFSGSLDRYDVALDASGRIVVTDTVGTDGVDTVSNVERMVFDGVTYTVVNGTNANDPLLQGDVGSQLILGFDGNDRIIGGTGNDAVHAGAGDDVITWMPNTQRDVVHGGTEGAAGDTFEIIGTSGAETFQIYTRAVAAAAVANGGIGYTGSAEIVITRKVGTGAALIIAELTEIEEIVVNFQSVSPPGGPVDTTVSGDTIQVFGDFSQTSLNLNTITVNGSGEDDTIDISALQSAHRIVFRSNGGNDTIVGTLRDQDVIELAPGLAAGDYTRTVNADGTTTLASASHKITYAGTGTPVIRECTGDQGSDDEENDEDPSHETPDDSSTPLPQPANEVRNGGHGDDDIHCGDGDDQAYGGAGNDRLAGNGGSDRLYGGDGNDRLHGGEGVDHMWGGRGNDVYYVDHRHDTTNEGSGQGIDTVYASVFHALEAHAEKLVLTGSADIRGTGNSLDNTLYGNAGDNVLKGGDGKDILKGMDGDDRLEGGTGNDCLLGGVGNDKLHGGAGDDKLLGGAGDDWLTGNVGRDIFVFEQGGGRDTVTDFRDGHDRVDTRQLQGVGQLADLSITQVGSDALIQHGSDILVLKGVNASDLDSSDFIF
jgi:Ca2+-binding RTX toxin-like protein